ncbi:lytic transglycosylase domain-containing protein [Jiangella endophytica]|uniref:lytic transglycosylase domain-containing protein n=1 Tax=Jiangella endophytica TaxID=1623398 RepID=UPI000E348052|nr:lytic transglycosylase domain-containing protein [Jiangella endophytica]
MLKKTLLALAAGLVLLAPTIGLLAVAALMNPAGQSAGGCAEPPGSPSGDLADDAPVPDAARPWIAIATQACADLPETWVAAVMAQESSFRPDVFAMDVNGGTWGLFQINQHIWRTVYGDWDTDRNGNGIWDIREPETHAEYGARYLCDLLDDVRATRAAHPDWPSTVELTELEALVIAHNAGPGRLSTYPDIPAVTREYLDNVRERMREWATPAAPAPTRATSATPEASPPGGEVCKPDAPGSVGELPPPPAPFAGVPGGFIPDPTSSGLITRQLLHLIAETRRAFPETGWACWSPRPGTSSEHPVGRACDVTFGNQIGTFPTDVQVAEGWLMATWLQQHAAALRVEYLIWQGLIWSLARDDEGWRPYDGGGMHDPNSPTGGHYDHLHITVF